MVIKLRVKPTARAKNSIKPINQKVNPKGLSLVNARRGLVKVAQAKYKNGRELPAVFYVTAPLVILLESVLTSL